MKIIVYFLPFLFLMSCGKNLVGKKDIYKASLIPQGLRGEGGAQFPIWLKCTEVQDSVFVMMDSDDLLFYLNVDFNDFDNLADSIVEEIITYGCLYVNYPMYEEYKSRPLVKDAKSDSIYQKYGIRGLIREYVTKEGVLKKEYFWDSSWEYIRYLFFQNNILFFYEHETPCFLISFFARADADSLEIFMKQNCIE